MRAQLVEDYLHDVRRAFLAHKEYFGSRGNFAYSSTGFDATQRGPSDIQHTHIWVPVFALRAGFQPV